MILVIDVGNTNITYGVYRGKELVATFRMTTKQARTSDEYGMSIMELLRINAVEKEDLEGTIIASVVPNVMHSLTGAVTRYLKTPPLIVGPGVKTGIKVVTENPRQIGADRIVDAVAAYEIYGGPVLVLDFGTATTYDLVSEDGSFVACIIAPGIRISAKALWEGTAKLPEVEIKKPRSILAQETISSMQAGLIYGQIGQTEYIVSQVKKASGYDNLKVVATGGLGRLISEETESIQFYNSTLTLEIGDKAPLEAGYYIKTGDSNKVYTCKSSEIPNLFLAKKTKAIQSELVPANGSDDSSSSAATFVLDKLVLGGTARTEAITVEQINDLTESGSSAAYAVVAPRKADLNIEKGGALLKAVFGIEADDIEVANATAEDYKKYGLDNPYCVLTLEYAGETVTLKITDDSDGYCYVVKNDIPVIYKVAKDKVSFRSLQYKDIASRLIFSPTITDVKTVTVDTPDQSYVFELKRKGDDIEISYQGKVLDTAKFKKFYQVLIGARIEKEEPADKTDDVVLRFTYAYHDESKANDVVEFHKLGDRKALAVLNGKSFGFDVLMTYVQKVYEDCEKVINNELVATDW